MSRVIVTVYPDELSFGRDDLLPDRTHTFRNLTTLRGILNRIRKLYNYVYFTDILCKIDYMPDYGSHSLKTVWIRKGIMVYKFDGGCRIPSNGEIKED